MLNRIIITGSRNWNDYAMIKRVLHMYRSTSNGARIVVAHGGNPRGADFMASKIVRVDYPQHYVEEIHPADWSLGRSAGPIRNQHMVDLGADACLAFPLRESRGTYDCIRRARQSKIPTFIFPANADENSFINFFERAIANA